MNRARNQAETIARDLLSLADYARRAEAAVQAATWAWLEGGSGSEAALRANAASYSAWHIHQRLLVDCGQGSTGTTVLGRTLAHPVLLAPVGFHRLVHPDGEVATARGALDTPLVVSTMASCLIEEIARASVAPLWFQLYLQPTREATLALLRRAEAAGCEVVVVTLDTPIQPASLRAQKVGFAVPGEITAANLAGFPSAMPIATPAGESRILRGLMATAPTWDDLSWLREKTRLPLLAKGVSHPDDAVRLMELGLNGIVLSNHGGRALDAAPPPLLMIPAVRAALGADACILLDGGIRTGSDVFKALALGADAVLIGRPQLHALAVAGSLGVAHMLKLLREELEVTMALAGCPRIEDITSAALMPAQASASFPPC